MKVIAPIHLALVLISSVILMFTTSPTHAQQPTQSPRRILDSETKALFMGLSMPYSTKGARREPSKDTIENFLNAAGVSDDERIQEILQLFNTCRSLEDEIRMATEKRAKAQEDSFENAIAWTAILDFAGNTLVNSDGEPLTLKERGELAVHLLTKKKSGDPGIARTNELALILLRGAMLEQVKNKLTSLSKELEPTNITRNKHAIRVNTEKRGPFTDIAVTNNTSIPLHDCLIIANAHPNHKKINTELLSQSAALGALFGALGIGFNPGIHPIIELNLVGSVAKYTQGGVVFIEKLPPGETVKFYLIDNSYRPYISSVTASLYCNEGTAENQYSGGDSVAVQNKQMTEAEMQMVALMLMMGLVEANGNYSWYQDTSNEDAFQEFESYRKKREINFDEERLEE